jgi:hypothetical protein
LNIDQPFGEARTVAHRDARPGWWCCRIKASTNTVRAGRGLRVVADNYAIINRRSNSYDAVPFQQAFLAVCPDPEFIGTPGWFVTGPGVGTACLSCVDRPVNIE